MTAIYPPHILYIKIIDLVYGGTSMQFVPVILAIPTQPSPASRTKVLYFWALVLPLQSIAAKLLPEYLRQLP